MNYYFLGIICESNRYRMHAVKVNPLSMCQLLTVLQVLNYPVPIRMEELSEALLSVTVGFLCYVLCRTCT